MKTQQKYAFAAALGLAGLLFTTATVSAGTVVTFSVDMQFAAFDPNTQTASVRGTFNGWSALALTNSPGAPNIWSGAVVIENEGAIEYKYVINPGTWELGSSHNRALVVTGGSMAAPLATWDNPDAAMLLASVTFRVDLAQQVNIGKFNLASGTVSVAGEVIGWGDSSHPMTNDPSILVTNQYGLVTSNVYVAVVEVPVVPGQTLQYKYMMNGEYENPAASSGMPSDVYHNRFYNAPADSEVLPIAAFSDAPYAPVNTCQIHFQVDMSAQALIGAFDPATGVVEVRGDFNGWAGGATACTNDPAAANTNIYKATVTITDGIGATKGYKFWSSISANSGYEGGDNRTFAIPGTPSLTLPLRYFDNAPPSDYLPGESLVTFRVDMTGAMVGGAPFNPGTDKVYINGVYVFSPGAYTWTNWDAGSMLEVTNNPSEGSEIYTVRVPIPKGAPVRVVYKFSVNGADNEAPSGQDHVRYIRSTGAYTMPLDAFGAQTAESSFGNLRVAAVALNHAKISWLGRPGVNLQVRDSLASGDWVDVPATDALSATNWPVAAGAKFFRLVKPNAP